MLALPIQRLRPLSTYSSPSRAHTRLEVHGVGAVVGLGQRERADRVQVGHRRQPALLLLVGAEHRDRLHGEVRVHAVERAHAAVRARPLHAHEARGGRAHARAAVAVDRPARHLQRRDLRDQRERELRPLPVAVDHGRDLLLAERAQPVPDAALVVGELLVEQVEVRHLRSVPPFRDGPPQCRRRGLESPARAASRTRPRAQHPGQRTGRAGDRGRRAALDRAGAAALGRGRGCARALRRR